MALNRPIGPIGPAGRPGGRRARGPRRLQQLQDFQQTTRVPGLSLYTKPQQEDSLNKKWPKATFSKDKNSNRLQQFQHMTTVSTDDNSFNRWQEFQLIHLWFVDMFLKCPGDMLDMSGTFFDKYFDIFGIYVAHV